jgi:large subunit ribosomal protein L24
MAQANVKKQAKLKVKKGDKVVVIAGKDKGKRHTRPGPQGAGGIIDKESPIHVSNVAVEDPKTGKPSRVGYKVLENGRKVRVARASGEVIDG